MAHYELNLQKKQRRNIRRYSASNIIIIVC